ncbi:MAG: hypothetical protein QM756_14885 [Polyangiaceae bacterium]
MAEPLAFVLALCGAALALSSFDALLTSKRAGRSEVRAASPAASIEAEDRTRVSSAEREFEAYLALCAAGDASACNRLGALHEQLYERPD